MINVTNIKARFVISLFLIVLFAPAVTSGKIIYVDADAAGANTGTSWEDAYNYFQDALADANSAEKPVETRVAQGVYRPDQGAGITAGDREATFQLINGVSLKGGYAGVGESEPNARNIKLYETILSGDLNGDDADVNEVYQLSFEPTRDDNSCHVVTGSGTDETAIIDGFTITDGNANGDTEEPQSKGGGMYNVRGNPTITDCLFYKNSSRGGGGMYNNHSSPTLRNCIFRENDGDSGGGMQNEDNSNPVLTGCTFEKNGTTYFWWVALGGGMCDLGNSNPILTNCTFRENYAYQGGGMHTGTSTLINCTFIRNWAYMLGGGMDLWGDSTLTNCTFIGNRAVVEGGGIFNWEGNPILTNCKFSGNRGTNSGGGMASFGGNPKLTNCIFSGNSTGISGGGMYIYHSSSDLTLTNCTFVGNSAFFGAGLCNSGNEGNNPILINCIMWSDILRSETITGIKPAGPEISHSEEGPVTVKYSNIQGGFPGEGNIDEDPLFVNPGYWAGVNDPNIILEPDDPNAIWVNGDYHLKSQAGRWTSTSSVESDPNSESWVYDDVTSPCIDAGDPNSPVGDEPIPNGGIINMGAHGGTNEASKSHTEE